ncbi:GlcNAc-transferase family protein [Candidatus Palauibacter sp.]|uniref:GlcNAc-transferase family protein n=1 Tax=Candidatus Palauibacter sp. TaxID=3101350 RepID=UPI003CC5CAD5
MGARVFVSLASLADPDTAATVASLTEDPGLEVRVGICLQDDGAEIRGQLDELAGRGADIDVIQVPETGSRGMGWARASAQTLWDGEPWVLICDAHMRWSPGWAAALKEQSRMAGPRSVLTTYPPQLGEEFAPTSLQFRKWDESARPLYRGRVDRSGAGRPIPSRWLSGNLTFAPSAWMQQVPIDPWCYYGRFEWPLAIRSWTAGWDLWHPGVGVATHYYGRSGRPMHWDQAAWVSRRRIADARCRSLLGPGGRDLGVWGLGRERTLAQYLAWAGLDVETRTATPEPEWRAGLAARARATPRKGPGARAGRSRPDVHVQIPSLDDPDTPATVASILEAPGCGVRVTVCLQSDDPELAHRIVQAGAEVLHVPVAASRGVGWARALAAAAWDDEPWVLGCDAHCRWEPGGIATLIAESESVGGGVLSAYPASMARCCATLIQLAEWPADRIFPRFLGRGCGARERPRPARHIAGGMWFGPAAWQRAVPVDPSLPYGANEHALTIRSWTAGWDLWSPGAGVVRHAYGRRCRVTGGRRRMWWDARPGWSELHARGRKRATASVDPARNDPLRGGLGLGTVRTFDAWESWAGISYPRRAWTDEAEWRESVMP